MIRELPEKLNIAVDGEEELRALESRDAPTLFALVADNRAHLREWLPWLDSNCEVGDTREFIAATQQQRATNTGFVTAIWVGAEMAGLVGVNRFDWETRSAFIGYWLAARWQGQGVMTRSCRALLDYGFAELGLEHIYIRCAPENRKSRAIPERLGFQQHSTEQEAEWLYDHSVALITYGLHRKTWRAAPESGR